jgi:hypothetical protein
MKPNGYIIYRGPSRIDGKRIVVIATGFRKSKNRKTGNMIQTWIVLEDIHPLEVLREGLDGSICGDCRHSSKGNDGSGACYVNVAWAPSGIWKAFKRGSYPRLLLKDFSLFNGLKVRFGAYGDPAAAPLALWRRIAQECAGHTGYTHQWKRFPGYRDLLMASVDTPEEAAAASARGYRTFRIRVEGAPALPKEFVCPASEEAGHKLLCEDCMACDGHRRGERRASPVIQVHGVWAGSFEA